MSAIRAMDAASPNRAPQASASAGPGGAESGHPFAEVMRSAVSPAQTAPRASDPPVASASSRAQFDRSSMTARTHSNRADGSVSNSSSQTPNGNPATRASNQDGQNADPLGSVTSSSAASDGVAPSLVDGQAQSSIPDTAVEGQSSGVASQRARMAATQTGSSPSETGRKQPPAAKGANASGGVSGAPTVATVASLTAASVSAIVPNIPVVKLPAGAPTGSSATTASTFGTKAIDAHTMAKDSSLSNPATASGLAGRIPQADGTAAVTGNVPHGPGIFPDGILDSQHPATVHGVQTIEERRSASANPETAANTTVTSSENQNGGSVNGPSGSQPASVADGISAPALTNSVSNSTADANTSNEVNPTGAGNSGAAATNAVGSGGNRAATSIHSGDGSKSSSFTAAIATVATAAKDLPSPHTNPADSGVGLHDSAGLVSVVGHPGASGSFSPSAAGSTAARATTADAFTALDSAAAGERGVLLHAAPHQVAVGVSDPSLGWVEVRAERVSGQIAAALTTNSAASHAALTSVLPTMATYLQEHQAGVHQVHVETSLAGGQAGTGSQGQPSSQSEARTAPDNRTVANVATNSWNAVPVGSVAVATGQRNNFIHEGHHFSIRA
ncbi:MAG: hypothetical protein WCE63_17475 [Acidobacteriaceae bacterium]